ncbi:MAG: hypothetical protein GQ537_01385 [Gammaproteobacteria bacterium]|nr:hypothetical protein [Gammaproteobacteria bacterium]
MKKMKKISTLAAGSMAIGLLLGPSLAQAQDVCYNDGGTVTGIKNLVLITNQFDAIEVNVDFKFSTAFNVYGPDLDGFPFTENAEEDAFVAMQTINLALTAEIPVPDFVGLSGQNRFFIGQEELRGLNAGLIAAWGGANVTGEKWDKCEEEGVGYNCILGATLMNPDFRHTYADLTRTDGSTCDDEPPPTDFEIIPGISGSWYDPGRDGEGYNFEVLETNGDYELYAYYYTYDDTGNQMWVTGTGPINGDTAVVEMLVTSGAMFGDAFRKEDVIREDWGTMTFTFSSCTAGSVDTVSSMGNFSVDFGRLTYVADLPCP